MGGIGLLGMDSLKNILARIDGKGYKAYEEIRGSVLNVCAFDRPCGGTLPADKDKQ